MDRVESVYPEVVRAEDGDGRGVGDGGGGGGAPTPAPPPPPPPHPHTLVPKQNKERHVVTWTQQEDDLLREQVGIHGTDNWTSIAVQFKDKTGRQCRRRWYTYLHVECKKGGWSPEEDMILCEAQKIFGNRWTEISKVVSGRTDNAVKNRFTTLCKKRAKQEAMSKENNCSYPISNSEVFLHQNGCIAPVASESSSALKKIRYQIANLKQSHGMNEKLHGGDTMAVERTRPPLVALFHNNDNGDGFPAHQHSVDDLETVHNDGKAPNSKSQSYFLKRDDPKISALLQQAELLSSLALKVHTDSNDQCLENAWKELKDYLIQHGERGVANNEVTQIDFLLDDFKDLLEDLRSSSTESPSVRQTDVHEDSRCSSEYGNGSNHNSNAQGKGNLVQAEESPLRRYNGIQGLRKDGEQEEQNVDQEIELPSSSLDSVSAAVFSPWKEQKVNSENLLVLPNAGFNSPLQTVPLFSPFVEGIPSPKFSASERQFLLGMLALPSSSINPDNPSQQPSCKRALLHSL